MNRGVAFAISVGLLLLAVSASYWLYSFKKNQLPILETLGGNFSLPSTLGRELSLDQFHGKVVLLNFGYTTCPDVCPTVLARMRTVLERLAGRAERVQPVFITIDPSRDSVEKLAAYLHFFHPSFIGMRGDLQQTKKIADLYRVHYKKELIDSAMEYGFLHNDHIYLLDQRGRVRAMYSGATRVEVMAEEIATLL